MTDDDRLLAPYRSLRPVSATADGPWPGMLVHTPDGHTRVMVDAAILGDAWGGWSAPTEGHLLSPLDVVRRRDGHAVLLPVCVMRVQTFLDGRTSAESGLSAGEAVTLGVSALRGAREVLDRPDVTGEWWLTDDGRPVLVTDVAPGTARDATIAVLTHLRAHARGAHAAAVWREAVETLSGVRVTPHDLVHLEDAAFGLAAPEPLIMTETAPRRVRDIEAVGAVGPRSESDAPHGALWHAVARHIDVDLADAVSRVTTQIWRRVRSDASPRGAGRAPWLVGGGTAAAVLAAGLLWPAGGGVATADAPGFGQTSRADESGAARTSHTPTPSPDRPGASEDLGFEPGSGAQPGDSAEGDITAIADELLERRRACGAESACLGETQLDPAAALTGGAIDLARPERRVVLLDDFGGAAVLRIDPVDTTVSSQLVVIVRLNDEWLLRDVHDVAQQP